MFCDMSEAVSRVRMASKTTPMPLRRCECQPNQTPSPKRDHLLCLYLKLSWARLHKDRILRVQYASVVSPMTMVSTGHPGILH